MVCEGVNHVCYAHNIQSCACVNKIPEVTSGDYSHATPLHLARTAAVASLLVQHGADVMAGSFNK